MPDAPSWLRAGFALTIDERAETEGLLPRSAYARGGCQEQACRLARSDALVRPCAGKFERFHYLGRQRVENALYALLPGEVVHDPSPGTEEYGSGVEFPDWSDVILLAEWDARNGGIACEQHHRRFDNHLTPPLKVAAADLPGHFLDFLCDWGLEQEAADKFTGTLVT